VLNATTCQPVPNAAVDIWHASAAGVYSGFQQQGTLGQTWLRGVQMTNASGIAAFNTIYPGWYMGRTQHIHVKVRPTPTQELTTQCYFRQSLNQWVNSLAPYSSHGQNPTTNASDGLFLNETIVNVLHQSVNSMYLELVVGVA
jgi:protocatechuate 3,4-dioxygenase beta subunit